MQQIYFDFLKMYNLENLLEKTTLSYSNKLKGLNELLSLFKPEILNMALREYYLEYIKIGRHFDYSCFNILKGLCKKYV
jgi:hypothetical protein